MEPVTCRWVRAQLTVAQHLYTRCITGLRVTPVSSKAVDVATQADIGLSREPDETSACEERRRPTPSSRRPLARNQ
jgi:hypothetical protein